MEAHLNMTGWVGTEVETRVTRAGQTTASFRLACTPRARRAGGEWGDLETSWLTVTCYRSLADNVRASVAKGDPVVVVGRLRTQAWVDADGQRQDRQVLEATAVGHDLTRGTAVFSRTERTVAEEEPDETLRDLILSVEADQASAPAPA
ncbi:single-stranded DNA-binding protein [Auraticoccus cholistanensis]|nr:single-stranded DNA-binding protein [Auraticoccus cholistanensis]